MSAGRPETDPRVGPAVAGEGIGRAEEGSTSWPELLTSLLEGRDLSEGVTAWAMGEVMDGAATPAQVAGFLVALRAKGETVTELGALADVMLSRAHRISVPGPTLDIVGTGGDRSNTVNISTMSAVCLAAAGVRVVKHGNRAASSSSGSADVLEALGVRLDLPADRVAEVAERVGITFCFAQTFHPSFRHTAVPRRELGIPTAFNVLGPLTNPAQPTYAAVGVADRRIAPLIAGVFAQRGRPALVVRGDDGLDELTLSGTTSMWWVADGVVESASLAPEAVGLDRAPIESLRGGDAAHNAEVARQLVGGERGAVRDAVLLNAGAALALVRGAEAQAVDPVAAVGAGVREIAEVIDDGRAASVLEHWAEVTRELVSG